MLIYSDSGQFYTELKNLYNIKSKSKFNKNLIANVVFVLFVLSIPQHVHPTTGRLVMTGAPAMIQ